MAAVRSTVNHEAASDIDGGDVIVQGDLVTIAADDIASGAVGKVFTHGVFNVVKDVGASTGIAIGAKVYWDATNLVATDSDGAGANKQMGKATRAAADGDRFVRILLTP